MANILPEYSLTEVSRQLRVPDAWVRRWEKTLDLKGSSGQQGKKSLYTDEIIEILQRIKMLQLIGLNNAEIKRLWLMEIAIKEFDRIEKMETKEQFYYVLRLAQPKKAIVLNVKDFKGNKQRLDLLQRHYDYYQNYITSLYYQTKQMIDNFAYVIRATSKINIGYGDWEQTRDILRQLGIKVSVPASHDEYEVNQGPNS